MIIVNGFQPLTIITKRSILDVAAALDLPLVQYGRKVQIGYYSRYQHSCQTKTVFPEEGEATCRYFTEKFNSLAEFNKIFWKKNRGKVNVSTKW